MDRPPEAAALKAAICEETVRLSVHAFGEQSCAIVLTGSLARDEATFVRAEGSWEVWGDAEFFLVFGDRVRLPPAKALGHLGEQIRSSLAARQIRCDVGVDAVHARYFVNLRPHILAYELRACGQVVWGDEQVLSLIPDFPASHIPREDAWRLLANRMIEQLEVVGEFVAHPGANQDALRYRTAKLYLDMATSMLVFVGAYEPTYRRRLERLSRLAGEPLSEAELPFPLAEFTERVAAATEMKLSGPQEGKKSLGGSSRQEALDALRESLSYAQRLWVWELGRLTGTREGLSERELVRAWMRLQPLSDRARGWLYVLRKRGWHHSWQEWPHWARLAWRASPRYWVYAVTGELVVHLPDLILPSGRNAKPGIRFDQIRRWLPVLPDQSSAGPLWQQLANDVAWNYREFLLKTRA